MAQRVFKNLDVRNPPVHNTDSGLEFEGIAMKTRALLLSGAILLGVAGVSQCEKIDEHTIIGSTAVVPVLALVALGLILYHFTKPIKKLAEGAALIGIGEFNHRVEVRSKNDLGYPAHYFNDMAAKLKESYSHLEENTQQQTAEPAPVNTKPEEKAAEQKKPNEKQTGLMEQLENAKRELKDFAYIVSHDLKAPLRGIKALASWLSTDYADKFDENGKQQMRLLLSRVDRMNNLIDGVLEYSRIGRVKEKPVRIDINKLVPEVIAKIAPPENITVTIGNELPMIECEQTRIAQVFENLLNNAVKYMDKPQGLIKVGCVEEDGFWKFSVADNGPGIEEKHFERIFQMFQTLAPRDKVESTGVGLTITKKIVELYGGRIWVESKVGEGSTFFFMLSKQEVGIKDAKLESSIAC
jgi:signal transduction histidine kinase